MKTAQDPAAASVACGLGTADFTIIAVYVVVSVALGFLFAKRHVKSAEDFFVSGRSLPWWLAGTALVATTFAADTPLAVTEMVAEHGVAGNWIWWAFCLSGMTTVFFFARLWRRSEVMTDVELAEVRYAGRPAAFLRGFRALYLGLFVNLIIMGWVNLGMAKVIQGTLDVGKWEAVGFCMAITLLYSLVSGHRGVAAAGGFQFIVAMGGAVLLAVLSIDKVGGIDVLKERLATVHPANSPPGAVFGNAADALSFVPRGSDAWAMPALLFGTLLTVNWWASWYPGAEPGGGGYVAQNIAACRDERHGRGAVMLFNFAHYAIRSWPWILTALAALVLLPDFAKTPDGKDDPGFHYVRVMNEVLPPGLRGLMLASFAAAYMSTQATQMNWGSSYLVNDLYRRFLVRGRSARHYAIASRVAVVVTLALSSLVTAQMDQVSAAWKYLMMLGSGTGLVYMLRWYWWRVNAWSEIAAMAAAVLGSFACQRFISGSNAFEISLLATAAFTTAVWVAVTLLTPPVEREHLREFYRQVHPAGPGWSAIAPECGLRTKSGELYANLVSMLLGVGFVYSALFLVGSVVLDEWVNVVWLAPVFLTTLGLLAQRLAKNR